MAQQVTKPAGGRIIGEAGQKQVQLPLSKAFQIAVQSIRVRFWRSMITAAGVLLGIAFLASTLAQSIMAAHAPPDASMAAIDQATRAARQQAEEAQQVWLVVMSLLVCTVGIANSMLMSVTERFKDIGTMKCLGALDSFIVKLFLLEASVLGLTASLIGFCIGFGGMILIELIRKGNDVWGMLPPGEVGMAFIKCIAAGAILTVLATVFPAIRASKLPPAAALRSEI